MVRTLIASKMENRSGKQCRERYNNHLAPVVKKGNWTKEEDQLIVSLQKELGNHWSKIASHLDGRSDNSVKNRWHLIHRCRPADIPLGSNSVDTVQPVKTERTIYSLSSASKSNNSFQTFSPPGTIRNQSLDSLDEHSPLDSSPRTKPMNPIDLMNLYHSHTEHAHFYSSEEKEFYSTRINYHVPSPLMMMPMNIHTTPRQVFVPISRSSVQNELNTSFLWGNTSDSNGNLLSHANASPIVDMMGSFNLSDHDSKIQMIKTIDKNKESGLSNQWIMDFIEYESKSDDNIKIKTEVITPSPYLRDVIYECSLVFFFVCVITHSNTFMYIMLNRAKSSLIQSCNLPCHLEHNQSIKPTDL